MATAPVQVSAIPVVAARVRRRPLATALAGGMVLLKVRIVGLVVFTGVVAGYVATRGQIAASNVLLFALAGALGAGGAAVLNHYLDRDIDACMARTCRRPLPCGQLQPRTVLLLGLGMLALAAPVGLLVHPTLPLAIGAGAIVYVGVYTWWLKRRTPHSVVLGGWTGSCAVLGGWAMTGTPLSPTAWALALVVLFWTPPHFWGLALVRDADYRAAGIPTLPAVAGATVTARAIALGAALTLAAALVPWLAGDLGTLYAAVALLGGGSFLALAIALCRRTTMALAWQTYKLSGVYLLALFVAALADVAAR